MSRSRAGSTDTPNASDAKPATRGVVALRRLLREETFDLRELDVPGFRRWLGLHLVRWQRDPIFRQRVRIRNVRREQPSLRSLEREHRAAARADAGSPAFERLRSIERALTGAERAIRGLTEAMEQADIARRKALKAKLAAFRERRRGLTAEHATLVRTCPERQALLRVERKLRRLREAIGLDEEERRLAELLTTRGRRGGRAGAEFERTAAAIVRDELVSELLRGSRPGAGDRVRVLRGVTLGAARIELDLVVVREPRTSGGAVDVLAVVEAKRNVNDLAHGFRRRQEDLSWLTGADLDPEAFRTRTFPTGRFDRRVEHREAGEAFPFGPDSFRRFRRDPVSGAYFERLYLVTFAGPVWGLSSGALSRIGHRVATDDRWDPEDDGYVGNLLAWCRSLVEPFETPDLLRVLVEEAKRARRVFVVEH